MRAHGNHFAASADSARASSMRLFASCIKRWPMNARTSFVSCPAKAGSSAPGCCSGPARFSDSFVMPLIFQPASRSTAHK